MNDRALRNIVVSSTPADKKHRDGSNRHSGFLITAASVRSWPSSRSPRAAKTSASASPASSSAAPGPESPVHAADLGAVGPMMALLTEAIEPNLAQTTEGTPAFVHCGPFANIAHGTSSVVSRRSPSASPTSSSTRPASPPTSVPEVHGPGLAASGIKPSAAVLVTTVQSVRSQGEGDLQAGLRNLEKHIAIVRGFQLPAIVAINRFPNDTAEDLAVLESFCTAHGAAFALSEAFAKGAEGARALAEKVVEVLAANPTPELLSTYQPTDSAPRQDHQGRPPDLRADAVELSERAQRNLARFEQWGYGNLPICIAKTQYSLSDDPKRMGAPTGWTLHITDVSLSAGAGFLVVISGAMMLMPGLPKTSRALDIDVDARGQIIGMS